MLRDTPRSILCHVYRTCLLFLILIFPHSVGYADASVRVYDGETQIPNGGGPIDFGSVDQGDNPSSKTFRVENQGFASLISSNLSVPDGYTITEGLDEVISTWTRTSFGRSNLAEHSSFIFNDRMWTISMGGYDTDVWSSSDGITWLQESSPTALPIRRGGTATFTVFNNKIWRIGGASYPSTETVYNDVWISDDGVNWVVKSPNAEFFPRCYHTSTVFNNRLWIIGGKNRDSAGHWFTYNDVWSSADGIHWELECAAADFSPRESHSAVVYDNKLWILGGSPPKVSSEVWSSTNGSVWRKETGESSFPGRFGHTSIVYDDKIYVIAGYQTDINDAVNDIWCSEDGTTWLEITDSSPFDRRYYHTSHLHDGKMWVLGGEVQGEYRDIWCSTAFDNFTVKLDSDLAGTFAGSIRFDNNDLSASPFQFSVIGVIAEPPTPTQTSTPTVTITHTPTPTVTSTPTSTTVPVANLKVFEDAQEISNGSGPIDFSLAFQGSTSPTRTFRVENHGDAMLVTSNLSVPDGYLVTEGLDSDIAPYSLEGAVWANEANDAFDDTHGISSVVYGGRIWVLGGGSGYFGSSKVRYSGEGITWQEVGVSTPFDPRRSHTSVVFDNQMWVIGGMHSGTVVGNDVWSSTDGVTWTQKPTAPFSPRAMHASVVFKDRIWVIAGNTTVAPGPANDVWSTPDGITWNLETASAAFTPRKSPSAVVFKDRIWLLGGSEIEGTQDNRIWYSYDGKDWIEQTIISGFPGRSEHTSVTFGGRIWVIGGWSNFTRNDVWCSEDGATWAEIPSSIEATTAHATVVFDNRIFVMSGPVWSYGPLSFGKDTFAVQLSTNSIGEFAGTVSFNNNDPSANPFQFTVTGEVIEPPTPTNTPTATETLTTTPTPTFTLTPTEVLTSTPIVTPTAGDTHTPTPTPTTAPLPAPENLQARAGADNISLNWEPGRGINGRAVSYRVYRSGNSPEGPWVQIAGAPVGPVLEDTFYTNRELSLDDTYWYYVTKVVDGEVSGPSNVAYARVGSIEIYIPDLWIAPGSQARIQVAFSSAYNVLGSALTLWVDYPEQMLTYTDWEKSPILSTFQYPAPNTQGGVFRLAGVDFEGQPMVGEGRILEILVDVPSDAITGTEATISFAKSTLYDPDVNPLDVVARSGKLTIGENFNLGDVNGDGQVDAGDALATGLLAVGREDFTGFRDPESYLAGDVNADRMVDSADVILILRLASGYPLNPPQGAQKSAYLKSLAQSPATYQVKLSNGQAQTGEMVTLSLSSPDLTEVAGGSFELSYDPTVLKFEKAEKGALASAAFWSLVNEDNAGVVKISTGGRENIEGGGGEIVRVTFKALTEYELSTPVRVTQARLARQYGEKAEWTAKVTRGAGIVVITSDPLAAYDLYRDGKIDYMDFFLMGNDWGEAYEQEYLYDMIHLME